MDEKRTELIQAAKAVCGELRLSPEFSAGTVGAAILTLSIEIAVVPLVAPKLSPFASLAKTLRVLTECPLEVIVI